MLMLPVPLMPPAAVKVNTLVDDQLRSAATLILPVPAPDVPELVVVMLMLLLAKLPTRVVALTTEVAAPLEGV